MTGPCVSKYQPQFKILEPDTVNGRPLVRQHAKFGCVDLHSGGTHIKTERMMDFGVLQD